MSGAAQTSPSLPSQAVHNQFQRLRVEDALSYLDQVKLQFGNQPQVYNDFLDIMKEFKSQSLDTPGVISRVSNLFRGHPDLIVGFNTFLPPGFKIEVNEGDLNLLGPPQHTHALQQIVLQHKNATAAAAAAAAASTLASSSGGHVGGQGSTSEYNGQSQLGQSGSHRSGTPGPGMLQPVEFNQAVNYVNKIRNRFQNQPDIYKSFLEILHTYQKEQRIIKEGGNPGPGALTEAEVYSQVSKLFQNQEDLLSEFGQFLPDCTAQFGGSLMSPSPFGPPPTKRQALGSSSKSSKPHMRRSSQSGRSKNSTKDILAEAGKHSNYAEQALFDKVRKALRNPDLYDSFLRCLVLFNEEIISRTELVSLVTPLLEKYPELLQQFKYLLGYKDHGSMDPFAGLSGISSLLAAKDRTSEYSPDIDFNSLKRYGASYGKLPSSYSQQKCSGRDQLCNEVLNDTWVSFPQWSEDSTFLGTRKTQYEEYIFRCEDERFELDVVLETNKSAIRVLEAVQKKLSQMSPDERNTMTLTNSLGGTSEVIYRKAIHRIYGDKSADIIEGLKKNPSVAVSVVLKRLKAKHEEWLEAQRSFNKIWREQLEKYYLKSLDHQGINFKATDSRAMRSKSLICEIETICDERQDDGYSSSGPHLTFPLMVKARFDDAVLLLLYNVKKQNQWSKEEKLKIKAFICSFIHDYYFYTRPELPPEYEEMKGGDSDSEAMEVDSHTNGLDASIQSFYLQEIPQHLEKPYHLFFCNNVWYTFFRLFQLLCERLHKVYHQSQAAMAEKEPADKDHNKDTIAAFMAFIKQVDVEADEYYPTFLDLTRSLLDGNIESGPYEDCCREMFGVHGYIIFTIDRLIQNITKQLQAIVLDEINYHLAELHVTAAQDGLDEAAYQKKTEAVVGDENCYKFILYKEEKKLTIELLEIEDSAQQLSPATKKWEDYMDSFGKLPPPQLRDALANSKIFMNRNKRCWRDDDGVESVQSDEEDECSTREFYPKLVMANLVEHGKLEFKAREHSYRLVPLSGTGDYMYRKGSLKKAKLSNQAVASNTKQKFDSWYSRWLDDNMLPEGATMCEQWLLGQYEDSGQQSEKHTELHAGRNRNYYQQVKKT